MSIDGIYNRLGRIQHPHVQLAYDLELHGRTIERELPLVIGVLAGLSGHSAGGLPEIQRALFRGHQFP